MFRTVSDFLSAWEYQTAGTQRVLDALTEGSLSTSVGEGHRDLNRLAWHIVLTIGEMAGRTGLRLDGPSESDPAPKSSREISHAYRTTAASLAEQVKANWNDSTLEKQDDMYGEQWPRGMTLMAILNHEVHHRGQMTVLMRQAGLLVPGVFGPSKEEWSQYGMEPPAL